MPALTSSKAYDDLVRWVGAHIAPALAYPEPPDDRRTEGYEPRYVHPSVHENYIPPGERMPDGKRRAPSLTVQLLHTSDGADGMRTATMRITLMIWDPGTPDGTDALAQPGSGWRGLVDGLDAISAALEGADTIAGRMLDRDTGVQSALASQDGQLLDTWPYWIGYVEFALRSGIPASPRFEGLL